MQQDGHQHRRAEHCEQVLQGQGQGFQERQLLIHRNRTFLQGKTTPLHL